MNARKSISLPLRPASQVDDGKKMPPEKVVLPRFGIAKLRGQRVFGTELSKILRAYYFGFNHPFKMRLWGWLMQLTRWPYFLTPYCERSWLALNHRDLVQRIIWRDGFYEPAVWNELARFIDKNEILWDIGGHVGSVSIRAALDPRVRVVHCFEPNPPTFRTLSLNLDLNQLNIVAHEMALSDANGNLTLLENAEDNTGISRISEVQSGGIVKAKHQIQARTVDQLVFGDGLPAPTVIKIDVESWEVHVFKGAKRLFAERPPKAIIFEGGYLPARKIGGKTAQEWLESFGYLVRKLETPADDGETAPNFIAVRP